MSTRTRHIHAKAGISTAIPDACQEIPENAQTLECLFFYSLRDFPIEANSRHQQEKPIIHLSKINVLCLTFNQHISSSCIIKRNMHFTCPDVDGTEREYA